MATRMEKYDNKLTNHSRTRKNQELYRSIYQGDEYSNIEGIKTIDKKNQIDINEVRKLINSRENIHNTREYQNLITKPLLEKEEYEENTEKPYDIREILIKAKEKKVPDNKERVLKNTEYEISQNIDVNKDLEKGKEAEADLRDLIDTITNASMLNKVNDAELAADLLADLKGGENTMVKNGDFKNEINNAKSENTNTLDKSFFTSSLSLSKKDFDDYKSKKHKGLKIFIIIIIIMALLAGAAYAVYIFM